MHTHLDMHFKTRRFFKIIKKTFKKHFHTRHILLFLLIFLFPLHHFNHNKPAQLIVWSVGQGQMITYSDPKLCVHFDMGGEKFPGRQLFKECGRKINKVFFSHWDWDHINFSRKAWRKLIHLCRIGWPGGKGSKKKKQFLSILPECSQNEPNIFKEIFFPYHLNRKKRITSSNKHSRIVVVKNRILIPGDSPGSSEQFWETTYYRSYLPIDRWSSWKQILHNRRIVETAAAFKTGHRQCSPQKIQPPSSTCKKNDWLKEGCLCSVQRNFTTFVFLLSKSRS